MPQCVFYTISSISWDPKFWEWYCLLFRLWQKKQWHDSHSLGEGVIQDGRPELRGSELLRDWLLPGRDPLIGSIVGICIHMYSCPSPVLQHTFQQAETLGVLLPALCLSGCKLLFLKPTSLQSSSWRAFNISFTCKHDWHVGESEVYWAIIFQPCFSRWHWASHAYLTPALSHVLQIWLHLMKFTY